MMLHTKRTAARQTPFLLLLCSWHLMFIFSFCILIAVSMASTDNEALSSSTNTISDSHGIGLAESVISSVNDSLSTNESSTDSEPEAPSCDKNIHAFCPDNVECKSLHTDCIQCDLNVSCPYGSKQKAMCEPKHGVNCMGNQHFEREYECRYCYQLPHWQTWCNQTTECSMNKPRSYFPARPFYLGTCWAQSDYLCLGRRCFYKQLPCNWSQGYKWSTTLLLSIFLGGFGVDRFYLGLWKEALAKLLTFGGLGVWTLVDVILIAVGYIGPLDGALYI